MHARAGTHAQHSHEHCLGQLQTRNTRARTLVPSSTALQRGDQLRAALDATREREQEEENRRREAQLERLRDRRLKMAEDNRQKQKQMEARRKELEREKLDNLKAQIRERQVSTSCSC